MPTLDDLPTISKLVALSANDVVPVSDSSASSSGASKVKSTPAALLAQGFTHAWVLNFNNVELKAQTVNNTTEPITLAAIPANSIVSKARLVVTTAFAGLTTVNVTLGRTATTNAYVLSSSVLTKTVWENGGGALDALNEVDKITAADQNLIVTFDPGANGQNLAALTAGQLVVLVSMTSVDDYANLVPAT